MVNINVISNNTIVSNCFIIFYELLSTGIAKASNVRLLFLKKKTNKKQQQHKKRTKTSAILFATSNFSANQKMLIHLSLNKIKVLTIHRHMEFLATDFSRKYTVD